MKLSEAAKSWLEYPLAHSQKKDGAILPGHGQEAAAALR